MAFVLGIIATIAAIFIFKQLSKVKHDRLVMEQFGILNFKETTYLINRFGRGSINNSVMMIYMMEKEAGMHPQFEF